ncbi:MAG: DNA-3-methyladenine glycosylase I [Anaerolinea sp.]|nr:DNA-3-methyladenine glycosylase I [Anaerolinea sp.]
MVTRCAWCGTDPLYVKYHDEEWGVPISGDDHALFERICLEGAQAGLSWITILRKRDNYRAAFDGFDPVKVAAYDEAKVAELLANPGIVRNRLKIAAAINNAGKLIDVQREFGSFSDYLWAFVDGKPIQNGWAMMSDLPAETDLSKRISKDLQKRGFKFVGSTICYAMMQAVGMVNDHTTDCFRYAEIAALGQEAL